MLRLNFYKKKKKKWIYWEVPSAADVIGALVSVTNTGHIFLSQLSLLNS